MDHSLRDSLKTLFARTNDGIKPGLECIEKLLETLENPQNRFPSIHVAGTNGKGSTAATIEVLLREAGLKTALFSSPHLVRFNERFKINHISIDDASLAKYINHIESADAEICAGDRRATFFECSVAIAYCYFADQEVDVAVIETGLGGSWDATNVIDPVLSVVTPIDYDHQKFLGDDILQIAGEKAGIIKQGKPVIVGHQSAESLDVLEQKAKHLNAPFISLEEAGSISNITVSNEGTAFEFKSEHCDYGQLQTGLIGEFQAQNAALAILAAECFLGVSSSIPSVELIRSGLEKVSWPGRFQLVNTEPPVYLDGAHNVHAAKAFVATLEKLNVNKGAGAFIIGVLKDKNFEDFLLQLTPYISKCWTVSPSGVRAMAAADLGQCSSLKNLDVTASTLEKAYFEAKEWASRNHGYVCVLGSLHLVGDFFNSSLMMRNSDQIKRGLN